MLIKHRLQIISLRGLNSPQWSVWDRNSRSCMIWTIVPNCFPSWRFSLTSSFFSLIPNSSLSAMIFCYLTSNWALKPLLTLTDQVDTTSLLQTIVCFTAHTLLWHVYANHNTSYATVKTDMTNL